MILIDEPSEPAVRTYLQEEARVVRGKAADASGPGKAWNPPGSWIDLSPVTTIPLMDKMTDDPELANFIASESGKFRYDYVRLRCSFFPSNGERFEKAWLEVNLEPVQPVASDAPMAWSIVPGTQYDTVEVTNSAKIGAKFKLVSGEVSQAAKGNVKVYSIRGYKEGGPKPFWEMNSNDMADLNGSLAFHLVVRSPVSVETRGLVKLSTMIGTRKFLVFHSKAEGAEKPTQSFVLPASPDGSTNVQHNGAV